MLVVVVPWRAAIARLRCVAVWAGVSMTLTMCDTGTRATDSGELAFQSGSAADAEISSMRADGEGLTKLTNNAAADRDPSWSPDGTKIAFTSDRDAGLEIYVMNADGSNVTRLTNDIYANYCPAWSPDGGQIAFTSTNRAGSGTVTVHVMNADGTGIKRVAPTTLGFCPAWSPNGSQIAFIGGFTNVNVDVYVMNADGSDTVNLTKGSFGTSLSDSRVAWTPDGARVAFEVGGVIHVATIDGTSRTTLPTGGRGSGCPAWSPDGRRIAFHAVYDPVNNWEISVMRADGTGILRLTNNTAPDICPRWRPRSP